MRARIANKSRATSLATGATAAAPRLVQLWQVRMKDPFDDAKLSGAHRFRDTFAARLLLAAVPIERVSVLLGHHSVKITQKFYPA